MEELRSYENGDERDSPATQGRHVKVAENVEGESRRASHLAARREC